MVIFFPETLDVPLGETTAGNTTYCFQWRQARLFAWVKYTGFVQILGSKIQDFFQSNNFFFRTHGYQIGDQKRTFKK